jgi:hypothetical protein
LRATPKFCKFTLTNCIAIFFDVQVVDNKLPLEQAIYACQLQDEVKVQKLHYHVKRELQTRAACFGQQEYGNDGKNQRHDVIFIDQDDACDIGGISPLTLNEESLKDNEDIGTEFLEVPRPAAATGASSSSTTSSKTNSNTTDTSTRTDDDALPPSCIDETSSSAGAGGCGKNKKKKKEGGQTRKNKWRQTSRQASESRLQEKVERDEYYKRYSAAFKRGTELLFESMGTVKISGYEPADQIVARLNSEFNLNGKKRLSKSTLYRSIGKGMVGASPCKKGPRIKIPNVLLKAVALHTQVSQVGAGELNGKGIKRVIRAAILGTEYEDKFSVESVWRKVLRDHPEGMQASNRVLVEDARAQWTTHDNLQQWFDDAKRDLLSTGLVLEREVFDENGALISELDFRSEEVERRIVNMDETHHDLSITGDKGGSRTLTYKNPQLQRSGKTTVKPGRHVTGVYATNAAGESLPPLYIFDSGAKIEDNFRVKMEWLVGLPKVEGRFGCPSLIESDSFYSVRMRGSMDDTLFNDYITRVILPLYPNISKTAVFDPQTGKLLCGPVVLKVDSGPGRIVATAASLACREAFHEMGLFILAGLPNATGVQQEMDALYGPFKSATYARGEMVLTRKLQERGVAVSLERARQQRAAAGVAVPAAMVFVEEEDADSDIEEAGGTRRAAAVTTRSKTGRGVLSLGFSDLAFIINGGIGEESIADRPFDNCFTREKVRQAWKKIGFVPFSRACIQNKHVRNELGQHQKNTVLENLQVDYNGVVVEAERSGLNAGVFDAVIPTAKHVMRLEGEDEQVMALLSTKGAFSASALWNVCGSRIGNCGVVIRAQREQIAIDEGKLASQNAAKVDRRAKLLANAKSGLEKFRARGAEGLTDKDWGDIIRWVLPESKCGGHLKDLRKKDAIVAKLATLERHWSTYITQVSEAV